MGFEESVRKIFPKQHQLALACIGFWVAGGLLVKFSMSGKAEEKAPSISPPSSGTRSVSTSAYGFEVPTLENFDAWAAKEENFAAWEKWISGEGNVDKWAKQFETGE